MDTRLAASSRDSHLALRRVERQQALIERLHAARGARLQLADLAHDLGVSVRTIARDIERLQLSGLPLQTHPGRGGGISLLSTAAPRTVTLDLPEIAALISSLTTLGPSATPSATSAMHKLTEALNPPQPRGDDRALPLAPHRNGPGDSAGK